VTASASSNAVSASLKRRILSLIYESLILAALLLAGALPVVVITRTWDPAFARPVLQIWLLLVCGLYYVWQWVRTGQTLPMKTWRLRLVTRNGSPLTPTHATLRYVLALASTLVVGLGFLWALMDRDRQFLHDRLAGTRIIAAEDDARAA
jgi:uncharacterized RDD family membrane protein YckC